MAKSKPAVGDVLAEIDAMQPARHYRCWLNSHTPEEQEVLLEIQRRWQSGYYIAKGMQKGRLYEYLKEKFGVNLNLSAFRAWLGDAKKTN